MQVSQYKTYLFNATEELKRVSAVLQKNNSVISDTNKLLSFSKFPFMSGISLSSEVKEKIRKKFSERAVDTGSLLLSLVSVTDAMTSNRHHILSVELKNEEVSGFYINYSFLKSYMRFGIMTLTNLSKTNSLERTIVELINEISSKGKYPSNVSNSSSFDGAGLEISIERLKQAINIAFQGNFIPDLEYFLFSIDNIRFKFASDYMSTDNHHHSGSKLLYNFYKGNYVKQKAKDIPDADRELKLIKNEKSLVKYTHDVIFSQSQRNAFQSMNNAVNLVIGAGGSGKTYMAKIICEKALELNAILHAHRSKELVPLLYTTYSKGSMEQFKNYCRNGGITSKLNMTPLIYSRSIECIKGRMSILNEGCDKSRYNAIEKALSEISVNNLSQNLKDENELFEKISNYTDYVFMSKDIPNVERYCDHIKDAKKTEGFIDNVLIKLGLKDENVVRVPNDIMSSLFNTGKSFPANILNKNVDKVLGTVNNVYLKNHNIAENKFKQTYESLKDRSRDTMVFSGIDYEHMSIKFDDIIFYLKYFPIMQDSVKQDAYRNLLQEMLKNIEENKAINFYKKVKLDNGKTAQQPDMEKIRLFYDLFPLSADLITDITDLDVYFEKIIVDEAVLVPGVFTPIVLSKTNSVILMGDINQLELDLNLQGDLNGQIQSIHGSDPSPYPLTYSETGDQISMFNHLKRIIDEEDSLKILVDNYRCRREIFELSQIIQNKYTEYIERYKAINNLTSNEFIKYFNSNEDVYNYNDTDTITSPFLFLDESPERYQILEDILAQNQVDPADVFIIVPFKEYIPVVKSMLKNQEIVVEILENIQGRDAQIVVYDSFITESTMNDTWKQLTMQKFNLILTRARNLFIFMGGKEVCWKTNLSNRSDEPAEIIQKFFRNDKVNVAKLAIEDDI